MTKMELVNAYVRGDLDRRGFIKKLTAVGVSSGAALAYAGSLAQNAAAAPTRTGAGFISRQQDGDDEYGVAVIIENIQEAIAAVEARIDAILQSLNDILSAFDVDDFLSAGFSESAFDTLNTLPGILTTQQEALESLGGLGRTNTRQGFAARLQSTDSLEDQIAAVADELNRAAGEWAAVLPAVEDEEARQLTSQIAIVAGRQAGVVSFIAGIDPIPGAFEQPIDPTEAPVG